MGFYFVSLDLDPKRKLLDQVCPLVRFFYTSFSYQKFVKSLGSYVLKEEFSLFSKYYWFVRNIVLVGFALALTQKIMQSQHRSNTPFSISIDHTYCLGRTLSLRTNLGLSFSGRVFTGSKQRGM